MRQVRVILCRHGATDYNARGRFLSRTDLPISPHGRGQCEKLADSLRAHQIDGVFSSPALRCRQTAQIICGNIEPRIVKALREIDFGEWEGLTSDQIEALYPGALRFRRADPAMFRPPMGENFADVAKRLRGVVATLQILQPGTYVVVSHRGTLGTLERLLRRLAINDASVTPIEPGSFHITDIGERSIS